VAAASREQAQGIEQVSTAVTQMDKVTQQSAANSEELAASAEELNAQSGQLQSLVEDLQSLVGGQAQKPGQAKRLGSGSSAGHQVPKLERRATASISSGKGKVKNEEKVLPLGNDEFEDF